MKFVSRKPDLLQQFAVQVRLYSHPDHITKVLPCQRCLVFAIKRHHFGVDRVDNRGLTWKERGSVNVEGGK